MSKYRAVPTTIDGIRFASKKEAHRYTELKLLERAKVITSLKLQVPFVIVQKSKYGRELKYVADFVYYENGKLVVEDTKGFRTDLYKLKKRMVAELYDVVIRET